MVILNDDDYLRLGRMLYALMDEAGRFYGGVVTITGEPGNIGWCVQMGRIGHDPRGLGVTLLEAVVHALLTDTGDGDH